MIIIPWKYENNRNSINESYNSILSIISKDNKELKDLQMNFSNFFFNKKETKAKLKQLYLFYLNMDLIQL